MTSLSGAPHKPTACPKNRVRYTTSSPRSLATRSMVLTRETLLTCIGSGRERRHGQKLWPPVPGQQLLKPMCGMAGDAREDVGEPRLRIDAIHLTRDDEAVHVCGAPASAVGTAEQP